MGYHPWAVGDLTEGKTFPGTVPGGQFDWGGRLRKSNGGAQRFPQRGRKSREECKGRRELDCEADRAGPKGWAVRPLKWYVSWVQNVVRQFGPYPSRA